MTDTIAMRFSPAVAGAISSLKNESPRLGGQIHDLAHVAAVLADGPDTAALSLGGLGTALATIREQAGETHKALETAAMDGGEWEPAYAAARVCGRLEAIQTAIRDAGIARGCI